MKLTSHADGFHSQVGSNQVLTHGCGVALVENQVQHVQRSSEAVLPIAVGPGE